MRPCAFETLSSTSKAVYRHIKFCHISTGNVNMVACKPEVGNQRKVVCPILNLPIKSNRHFHRLPPQYAVGMVSWCQNFSGSAIWLTNKLRNWTEMYGLKMWLRSKQCNTAANKALSVLGMIKRSFSYISIESFKILYNTYVRPHLEYCVQIWNPYLKKDIECIEKSKEKQQN